jgi:hypothetical protein
MNPGGEVIGGMREGIYGWAVMFFVEQQFASEQR